MPNKEREDKDNRDGVEVQIRDKFCNPFGTQYLETCSLFILFLSSCYFYAHVVSYEVKFELGAFKHLRH